MFVWKAEWKSEKGRNKAFSSSGASHEEPQATGAGPGWNQPPGSPNGTPALRQVAQVLGPAFDGFPGTLAVNWIVKDAGTCTVA